MGKSATLMRKMVKGGREHAKLHAMKFNQLRAIGHNIADSLADGNGFLIGHYNIRLFEEVRRSSEGLIEVDFLTGASSGGQPSPALARAFALYSQALPVLCVRHGISGATFRQLSARFFADGRFVVTVEDSEGRSVTDEYVGSPGRRIQVLDPRGRIRRKRGHVVRTSSPPGSPSPEAGVGVAAAPDRPGLSAGSIRIWNTDKKG